MRIPVSNTDLLVLGTELIWLEGGYNKFLVGRFFTKYDAIYSLVSAYKGQDTAETL